MKNPYTIDILQTSNSNKRSLVPILVGLIVPSNVGSVAVDNAVDDNNTTVAIGVRSIVKNATIPGTRRL